MTSPSTAQNNTEDSRGALDQRGRPRGTESPWAGDEAGLVTWHLVGGLRPQPDEARLVDGSDGEDVQGQARRAGLQG